MAKSARSNKRKKIGTQRRYDLAALTTFIAYVLDGHGCMFAGSVVLALLQQLSCSVTLVLNLYRLRIVYRRSSLSSSCS